MALTDKQQRFVQEYLLDLNASAAARRAGYSAKTAQEQGSRLLLNVMVQEAIAEAQDARSKRTEITQDRVLQELAKIGFADIRKAIRWGATVAVPVQSGDDATDFADDGEPVRVHTDLALIASDEIDDDTAAAISEIKQTKEGLAIKFHPKLEALGKIGQHLGMFKEKVELTGKDDGPIETVDVTDRERAKALAALIAKAKSSK
jgi:phage terminase small subunit